MPATSDCSLDGRKALIVGAYGGMGRAVVAALAGEGVSCAVLGRSRDKLENVVRDFTKSGAAVFPVVCDLAQTATIGNAVRDAIDSLGGLNIVVNCAGSYELSTGDEGKLTTWDRIIDVNLRGTYHVVRHALPEIIKSPHGAIIKIGSIASSYSGAGPFLATSRGIDGYAEALFEDVREYGIKVCTIKPGFVNTPLIRADNLDRSLMVQPADIARTVLYVLSMPETTCPTEITLRPQRSPYKAT